MRRGFGRIPNTCSSLEDFWPIRERKRGSLGSKEMQCDESLPLEETVPIGFSKGTSRVKFLTNKRKEM